MEPETLELIAMIRWMVGGASGLLVLVLGGILTVILQQRDQLAKLAEHQEVGRAHHEATVQTLARVEAEVTGLSDRVRRLESQHHVDVLQ